MVHEMSVRKVIEVGQSVRCFKIFFVYSNTENIVVK